MSSASATARSAATVLLAASLTACGTLSANSSPPLSRSFPDLPIWTQAERAELALAVETYRAGEPLTATQAATLDRALTEFEVLRAQIRERAAASR